MAEHCSVSNNNSIYQQQVLSDRVLFLFSKPFKTSTFLGQVLGPILASLAGIGDPHPSLVPPKTEKPPAPASHLKKRGEGQQTNNRKAQNRAQKATTRKRLALMGRLFRCSRTEHIIIIMVIWIGCIWGKADKLSQNMKEVSTPNMADVGLILHLCLPSHILFTCNSFQRFSNIIWPEWWANKTRQGTSSLYLWIGRRQCCLEWWVPLGKFDIWIFFFNLDFTILIWPEFLGLHCGLQSAIACNNSNDWTALKKKVNSFHYNLSIN